MKIKQTTEYITLDQDQYIKNIVSRFEKNFKHQFKVKDCRGSSSDTTANKINPYYLIG